MPLKKLKEKFKTDQKYENIKIFISNQLESPENHQAFFVVIQQVKMYFCSEKKEKL